jgi:hypothetical protein
LTKKYFFVKPFFKDFKVYLETVPMLPWDNDMKGIMPLLINQYRVEGSI